MKLNKEREEQFFTKIRKTDACWLWTAGKDKPGYAHFQALGQRKGHRVSYIHHKGEIPVGYEIDHLCSNTSCVNPDHLDAVTFIENQARSKIRNRWRGWPTHCKEGHVMDDHNTFWRPNGTGRQCRTCIRARQSEHAVRNGGKPFVLGKGPNGTLKNKHLYDLTAEDYERANLTEAFIEVFWACDDMKPYGQRDTMVA